MDIIGNDWNNYPIKSIDSPDIGSKDYSLKIFITFIEEMFV